MCNFRLCQARGPPTAAVAIILGLIGYPPAFQISRNVRKHTNIIVTSDRVSTDLCLFLKENNCNVVKVEETVVRA